MKYKKFPPPLHLFDVVLFILVLLIAIMFMIGAHHG